MVNFYALTHPILAKTKNQILLFFANSCKQPQKNMRREEILKKPPNILEFKDVDHVAKSCLQ